MLMKNVTTAALLGLLTLPLFTGCGGDDAGGSGSPAKLTDAGYASLGSSDYDAALASFQKAKAGIQPGGEGFIRAAMGEIEALVHIDSAKAREKFLELARGFPDAISTREYKTIGGQLTSERKFSDAIAVLDAGLKANPEDPSLTALIDRVSTEAAKAGDQGAMDALKGLGYL